MSGHSKWATIHRQKESRDARRGQIFTKIGNAITIAVRTGGGITDPEKNFKLRLAIEKARAFNMPKENVQRAIARATGEGGGTKLEEVAYEGYGPEGIGVIVETVTDNKNRTTAEVKNIFERSGGSLAGPGAVSFQFQKVGLLTVKKSDYPEEQILKIMDLGVEDVEEAIDVIEVWVKPEELINTKAKLQNLGFEVIQTEQDLRPKTIIKIDKVSTAEKILRFMESLESQDDVQKLYSNFDIADEIIANVSKTQN